MPPKFESSFIPKGPVGGTTAPLTARRGERTLLGFLARIVFVISVLAAAGALGYKFYLDYSIENMKAELEAERAALETETVSEITRLNNRLLSTEALIGGHWILTPIFRFLDDQTVRQVRFDDFFYSSMEAEPKVIIKGEARSYAALAQQAELLKASTLFKDPVFHDLRLDDKGNVDFAFEASVNAGDLSYRREIEKLAAPVTNNLRLSATSTATTTRTTATSTSTSTQQR